MAERRCFRLDDCAGKSADNLCYECKTWWEGYEQGVADTKAAAVGVTSPAATTDDSVCRCEHARWQHIYEEGPCRPGFPCGCHEFRPAPIDSATTSQLPAPLGVSNWPDSSSQ